MLPASTSQAPVQSTDPSFASYRNLSAVDKALQEAKAIEEKINASSFLALPPTEQAKLYMQVANGYLQAGHYDDALKFEKGAEKILEGIKVPLLLRADCYHVLATIYRERQELVSAYPYFQGAQAELKDVEAILSALPQEDQEKYQKLQIDVCRNYGIAYLCGKKYDKAVEQFLKGVEASEKNPAYQKAYLALRNYFALALGLAKSVLSPSMLAEWVRERFDISLDPLQAFKGFTLAIPLLEKIRAEWEAKPEAEKADSMDYGSHLFHTARVREKYAKDLFAEGKEAEAITQLRLAEKDLKLSIQIRERAIGQTGGVYANSRIADPAHLLGKILVSLGQKKEGEECLMRAKACYEAMQKPAATIKSNAITSKWLSVHPSRSSIFLSTKAADTAGSAMTATTTLRR